ncbi:MAG: helix-turn-helix transcriptional regulator [Rudaea sp.]|uniref:helix-turn-helix transcriptional regulator n=1 Tax=unclassified Rudaea TaxID=2627037 RepID=UPI0010F5EECD|nr:MULTISPECIES: helix-turn-helix transcriptional regulator [unclassified Rudaea]MBN8887746.1 helix-turn-helix transcriptional regulator [Rudaea sp.]MBR0346633.1 helix-turn-helix transcriptional regulator [Rudaea sp.]
MTTIDHISTDSFSLNQSQKNSVFELAGAPNVEASLLLETVFDAACRWVERNYQDPTLDPAQIARNLRCSRATLYRAFQARGLTVSGFIRQVRLEQVCARFSVAAPRVPISSIALECGFECLRHFNRSFKAAFGSTAGQLRTMLFVREAGLSGASFG